MKILSIEIAGFGKWQQKKITFAEYNQLLYGRNEAGKSTIYQFIQAILFGFPAKGKKKKDYTPKNGGNYGGSIWLEHPVYGNVKVERFKALNKGQASVYWADQTGDEKMLAKILHPLTKELFQTVFTFQQEQLNQLDKLEEEELQTALLALGISGSDQLLKTREEYFKKAQEIYKSKGSRPYLNQQLAAYQELSGKIRKKEQEEQQFSGVNKELAEVEAQMTEYRGKISSQRQKLAAVEKQLINYPLYEEARRLEQTSTETKPAISGDDKEQLLSLYQEHKFLKEELERLSRKLQETLGGHDLTPDYLFYLNEEENIRHFLDQRYTINKLLSEIDWMVTSVQQNKEELLSFEKKWHWSPEQPPHLFFEEDQLLEMRQGIVERHVQLHAEEEQRLTLEESIREQEKNLEVFESVNKSLFAKDKKSTTTPSLPFLLLVAAAAAIGGGLFLSGAARWGLWGVALICLIVAGLLFFFPKADKDEQVKKQWQQKLSNLDYLNEQLHQVQETIRRYEEEEQLLEAYVQKQTVENNLGKMDRLEFWMNYKEDISRYLLLLSTNQELAQQIKENQQTANQWLVQTERYAIQLPLIGRSLSERLSLISDFADEMEHFRIQQGSQADIYTKQAIKEVKDKQQRVIEEARPLLYKYQILAIEDTLDKVEEYQQQQTADSRKEELQQLLSGIYAGEVTQEQLLSEKYLLSSELTKGEEAVFQLQKEEQRLVYSRQQMIQDGTLDQLYQEQAILRAAIEASAAEWSGYQLAGQLLMDLLTELSEQQLPALLKAAAEYFSVLTEKVYTELLLIDGKLQVKNSSGQAFAVYDLSTGTKDQLIMAIRFAFLSLQGEKHLFPVMIDDGWLHYDSQRKEQLAKLFELFGKKRQVICFSSDQEMVSYYQEQQQLVIQLEGESK